MELVAGILSRVYHHLEVWKNRPNSKLTTGLVVFFLLFNLLRIFSFPDTAKAELSLGGGFFYREAGGIGERGFSITDEANMPLWQEYLRLGGPTELGYPASWRFVGGDGLTYQATQGALLQWEPKARKVVLARVVDMISQSGKESLLAARGIPGGVSDDGAVADYPKAVTTRLGWLTNAAIRTHYYANPNPQQNANWDQSSAIEIYGLPTSLPQPIGPFVLQRFQRAVLQLWIEPVPGMPEPGAVVRVLVGDIAKEAGLVPPASVLSLLPDNPLLRADPELREPVRIIEDAHGHLNVAFSIRDNKVAVIFAPLDDQTIAQFLPGDRLIEVNQRWRTADPRALAAVLSHEATHVADYYAGVKVDTPTTCLDAERRAFTTEAGFWVAMFGPNGKQPPDDGLDRQMNNVESMVADQAGFARQLPVLYRTVCGSVLQPFER